jgi:hypothetical protein
VFYLSRPIDAVVHAAQHPGTVRNRRRFGAVVSLVVAAMSAGCIQSPSTEPSPSTRAAPSLSSAPSAEPSTAAGCDDSAHAAGTLTFRLEHFTETGRQWVISLYDDGRLITPTAEPHMYSGEGWMVVRRLTDAGAAELVGEVEASGLVEYSASYQPVALPGVEPPGRGGSGYAITLARPSGTVEVGWTSMFGDDDLYYEPSPEREQLDALATHLVEFEEWLSEDAWAVADPCPYQPQAARVMILNPQEWGGSLDDLPADIADVPWPPGGDILEWGEPFDQEGTDPGTDARCGTLEREEAQALVTQLVDAGADLQSTTEDLDETPAVELWLGHREQDSVIYLWLRPLLPDESGCTDATLHPFGV